MKDYLEREEYLSEPTDDSQPRKEVIEKSRRRANVARWGFSSPEATLRVIDTLMTCLAEEISGLWGAIDFHEREFEVAKTFLERHFSGVYLEKYHKIVLKVNKRLAFLQKEVLE